MHVLSLYAPVSTIVTCAATMCFAAAAAGAGAHAAAAATAPRTAARAHQVAPPGGGGQQLAAAAAAAAHAPLQPRSADESQPGGALPESARAAAAAERASQRTRGECLPAGAVMRNHTLVVNGVTQRILTLLTIIEWVTGALCTVIYCCLLV